MKNYSSKKGFTLAEVLITLGIIGVVAAITIPTVTSKIQEFVLKNQFRKFYSTFTQAVFGIQTKNGRLVKCYYWNSKRNPYTGKCTATCTDRNDFGTCTVWACAETGEPLPSDYTGAFSECTEFYNELFYNTLKTTKICDNKAYEQGCLPKDFRGADVANSEKNPDENYDPNGDFSDSKIKNSYSVAVLSDGTYLIKYSNKNLLTATPVFTVDINGFKGPNKWGYDIFSFQFVGDLSGGITTLSSSNYATEKGGRTFQQMYDECFK